MYDEGPQSKLKTSALVPTAWASVLAVSEMLKHLEQFNLRGPQFLYH